MDRSLFSSFKKFISKTSKEENKNSPVEKIASAIKESRIDGYDKGDFIGDFKYPVKKEDDVPIRHISPYVPKVITSVYKEKLKSSIVISLYDLNVVRDDLEFIGKSRIDGRPIYRYVGEDFSKFDLPYEELVSTEDVPQIPISTSPYVDKNFLTEYSEYLADQLDKSIAYSEYVAESISKM
jgi:hypothetical protein